MASESQSPREWNIKRYEAGDEVAILALFNQVFGLDRSLEHWQWQFKRNPYAGPFASQARRNSDGALVGTHIVMPFQLNVRGRPVLAAQTLDLVVHPDYRRQGIFETAARDCFESFGSAGVRAVVAFPNASSYPGFVRSLEWMRILVPTYFGLKLDLERDLARAVKIGFLARWLNGIFRLYRGIGLSRARGDSESAAGADLKVSSCAKVPEGHERLWQAHASQEVLSVWKDSRYFRWRYDENPDHEFTYHSLTRAGEMVAIAVTVERDQVVTICELIVVNRSAPLGHRLVREICGQSFQRRARAINFIGHDSGFFAQVFEGFRRREASENVFVGRALGDPTLNDLMARPENWTVTLGDADFV